MILQALSRSRWREARNPLGSGASHHGQWLARKIGSATIHDSPDGHFLLVVRFEKRQQTRKRDLPRDGIFMARAPASSGWSRALAATTNLVFDQLFRVFLENLMPPCRGYQFHPDARLVERLCPVLGQNRALRARIPKSSVTSSLACEFNVTDPAWSPASSSSSCSTGPWALRLPMTQKGRTGRSAQGAAMRHFSGRFFPKTLIIGFYFIGSFMYASRQLFKNES